MKPPGVKEHWDDMDAWAQALLIAYDQRACFEESGGSNQPKSPPPKTPPPNKGGKRRR